LFAPSDRAFLEIEKIENRSNIEKTIFLVLSFSNFRRKGEEKKISNNFLGDNENQNLKQSLGKYIFIINHFT